MRQKLLAGLVVGALVCLSLPAQTDAPSPFDLERVQPGQQAPEFTLPAADGNHLSLSQLRGKNVVLVFYRGYW